MERQISMDQAEQHLHLVMDESDAPYEDGQYIRMLEDDLIAVRFAKEYGLEFTPGSRLAELSRAMDKGRPIKPDT